MQPNHEVRYLNTEREVHVISKIAKGPQAVIFHTYGVHGKRSIGQVDCKIFDIHLLIICHNF